MTSESLMMKKAMSHDRSEGGGVVRIRLPRGSVADVSPPSSKSTEKARPRRPSPSSRKSNRSLEWKPDPSGLLNPQSAALINNVAMTELLDQDERPSFIIDLTDSKNYGSGSLQVLYANFALRGFTILWDTLLSSAVREPTSPVSEVSTLLPDFKGWCTSRVHRDHPYEPALSTYNWCGLTWSASVVRKRLRVFSGVGIDTVPSRFGSDVTPSPLSHPGSERRWRSNWSTGTSSRTPNVAREATDYFSSVPLPPQQATFDETEELTPNAPVGGPNAVLDELETPRPRPYDLGLISPQLTPPAPIVPVSLEDIHSELTKDAKEVSDDKPPFVDPVPKLYGGTTETSDAESPSNDPHANFFDWTRLAPGTPVPEHIAFARGIDWSSTSLGPMSEWPITLRTMCNLIMASPHPAAMYWGDELIAIYNEAYIPIAGQKHPELMGQSYIQAWGEIWDQVKGHFVDARETGQAIMKDDDRLFIKRSDYYEEAFFSWSLIPLLDQDGSVVGMYNPAFEKTRRKIVERRMLTLREVGEATAAARNSKAFWSSVINGFNFNEWDTPFLLLYSITDDTDDESPSTHSGATFNGGTCHLEGSLGVPAGHPAAPEMVDLRASGEGYTPYFRQALASFSPILLNTSDGSLPEFLVASLDARGFKEPTRSVVICPIVPTTGEAVYGFLILGINPRRPYDDEYVLFVQLLSRQLATSLASVVLFEEEIKRGQKAARRAAMDHYALSKELAVRTQEAQESEKKLSRMAALAPVGLFTADERGMLTFCNEALCAIIGKTRSEMQDWISFVREEDSRVAKEYWHTVIVERKPASAEFRFQQSWQGKNGESGELWVLATGYPEDIDTGSPTGSVGTITDISQQKWAEGLQKQRMEEAQEQKRQQENFIDTTSHEMRNPLSAIFQCADQISLAMAEYCVEEGGDVTMPVATAESVADAAQTISLCAQHQKRIVDDVLTVSKLDSALLIITPVAIQPVKIVQRAMKMFRNELDSNDIRLTFDIDDSYDQLNVDWVKLDPSRLLQILINLMTNAIKFTSPELTRTITVTIGASNIRPSETRSGSVHYVPCRTPRQGSTMQGDWGDGEEIFMNFAVTDTGRGLSPDEIKLLFLRFSQTTPKTHVQYGGSGLGLFISRELTELQGGEIGVASESGKGSTFAFYIVGRRSEPPENEIYDPTGGMLMKSSSGLGGRPSAQSTARSSDEQVVMVSTNASSPAKTKARRRPAGSSSETQKPVAGTESSANLQSPPIRVLVVEDNLVNQRVLQRQLQTQGCFATVAGHGVECIEMLKNTVHWKGKEKTGTELDLILMDLEMPVMDGMTCAEEIRKLEREGVLGGHVPIICVTANARDQQIQAALDAGMDDILSKPFRIHELMPKMMTTILKSKGKADIGRSLLNINTPPALTPQILPPAPRPNATLGSPLTSDITFSPASIVSRDAAASSAAIVSAISSNPSSVLPILGKPALVSDAAITSGPSIGSGKSISTTAGITPGKMTEAKGKDSASAAQHAQPLTTAAAAPTASVSTKQEAVGGTTTKDL